MKIKIWKIFILITLLLSCNNDKHNEIKKNVKDSITQGKYHQALGLLSKIDDKFRDTDIYFYFGKCFFFLEIYDESKIYFKKALELDTKYENEIDILLSSIEQKKPLKIKEPLHEEIVIPDDIPKRLKIDVYKKLSNLHPDAIAYYYYNSNIQISNFLLILCGKENSGTLKDSYLLLYKKESNEWNLIDSQIIKNYRPIDPSRYLHLNKSVLFKLPVDSNSLFAWNLDNKQHEEVIIPALVLSEAERYYIVEINNDKIDINYEIAGLEFISKNENILCSVFIKTDTEYLPAHIIPEKRYHIYKFYKFQNHQIIELKPEDSGLLNYFYNLRKLTYDKNASVTNFAKLVLYQYFNMDKPIDKEWYSNHLNKVSDTNLDQNDIEIKAYLNNLILGTRLELPGK